MHDPKLKHFARALRQRSTDAELRVWSVLRDKRLNGHKFRRQHPINHYIVDFYCDAARLAIELDGGQHFEPAAIDYDRRRTESLAHAGIKVMRFSNIDALKHTSAVAESILEEIELRLAGQ